MAKKEKSKYTNCIETRNNTRENLTTFFLLGIILNGLFVVVEFFVGFIVGSIGLISDAGHNLSDIISLILALFAMLLANLQANTRYTYGYKKTTILASLINALLLLTAIVFIVYESVEKLFSPVAVEGGIISLTAAIGVIIKAITTILFHKNKDKDLNIKGVYLHMLADTCVGLGVVISGIVMNITHWYFIDGIIGLLISIIIFVSTWKLLVRSIRLTLDGVPYELDFDKVVDIIREVKGVKEVNNLHIWAISTRENALTAHILINNLSEMERIKTEIRKKLLSMNINHITLEIEKSL
ncbi:MAG: cation diffusion facilitator family transporter [Bacteroidota bacterium]|nr:cation diffusion facilitator family transporter [Bacteroidota bacterium]